VAATLKYADAVLKTLATSGSIGRSPLQSFLLYSTLLHFILRCTALHSASVISSRHSS
jgi:hypothetical protein